VIVVKTDDGMEYRLLPIRDAAARELVALIAGTNGFPDTMSKTPRFWASWRDAAGVDHLHHGHAYQVPEVGKPLRLFSYTHWKRTWQEHKTATVTEVTTT
jgi:hypothetical protein